MNDRPEGLNIFQDLPLAKDSTAETTHPAAIHLAAAPTRSTSGRRKVTASSNESKVSTYVPDGIQDIDVYLIPAHSKETEPTNTPTPAKQALEPAKDFAIIDRLAEEISGLRVGTDETPENRDEIGRGIIATVLSEFNATRVRAGDPRLSIQQISELQQLLFNQAYRLGPVQPLIDDETVENIHINGCDQVIIRREDGSSEQVDPIASSDQALIELVQSWANELGEGAREFNMSSPRLAMTLSTGDRLQATHPPVTARPTLVIRCHRIKEVTLNELVERYNMLSQEAADFLDACVKAHISIVIAGMPGTGKSVFMRALTSSVETWEPVITIESERELHLGAPNHYNVKSLEARPGMGERNPLTGGFTGEITLKDLATDSLRMDTERIFFGETRTPEEAEAMMLCMASSAGSMTTLHATTPRGAINKLSSLLQRTSESGAAFAYQQINDHIQIIVQLARPTGQRRHVMEIAEVQEAGDGERPITLPIFKSEHRGAQATFTGQVPSEELLIELEQTGYDVNRVRGLES